MTIVITMAGLGSRFRKAGYTVPKYRIEVHGKTLFSWSMESLKSFRRAGDTYIFIVRREDNAAEFIEEECRQLGIARGRVIEIDEMTDGQATTAMLAKPLWDSEQPLLIYNIDTYVEAGEMTPEQMKGDGFVPCFQGEGDHWSFVRLGENAWAQEVREKVRISEYCTLGAYYFRTGALYERLYREYYKDASAMEKGEKYIAPLYNLLIEQGGCVGISDVAPEKVHVLGTPEELEQFRENYGK